MQDTLLISNTTKGKLPRLPFVIMKDAVLGKKYDLSVVFVGKAKMRTLNRTYRKKDYATDILSFPLSNTEGEIFICKEISDKKSNDFGRTETNYLAFLFIHGLVHLLGYDHGTEMEKIEQKFQKKFKV